MSAEIRRRAEQMATRLFTTSQGERVAWVAYDVVVEKLVDLLAAPAVPAPQEEKHDEEVVVAMLAACEATIRHLWDIAGRFDSAQCNRIRDQIHILNAVTLPSIRDLQAKALAAVPAQEEGWQPIDTAPKDGRDVLCAWDTVRTMHVLSWFQDWHGKDHGAWVLDGDFNVRFEPDGYHETPPIAYGNPTHWRPLPDPPGAPAAPHDAREA